MKVKLNKRKVSVLPGVAPMSGTGHFVGSSCVPEAAFHGFLGNKNPGTKTTMGAQAASGCSKPGYSGLQELRGFVGRW